MNMDDCRNLVKNGGSLHWYGPGIASIVLTNEAGPFREFYNFYGGKCAIEDIHDHRGNLNSTILKGGMRNHVYELITSAFETSYCSYRGRCVSACSAGRDFCCNFEMIDENVELNEVMFFDSYQGDTYYLDWRKFHWVELLTANVISHVEFGPITQDVPTLVRNVNKGESCTQGPGSAIDDGVPSNRPGDAELWNIIEQVITA